MMPGETHSKAAGIASEAAGSCLNCTALQQNLNEYVAALIALKQKIIESDHLLAKYQQKCDDLQYAERANETLRCQLEQMLQKISPQERNEEELKSLRAELEEKTSTLKIYQQTQMEYTRVKEECLKSDVLKKKLETKLKKMEEAAAKRVKDLKQLQLEKKVLEKELKKIQKRLNGFQKEKCKKAMKNAQTQVAKKESAVALDKQKIRFLLEELWGCIDSSTDKSNAVHMIVDEQLSTFTEVKVRDKIRVRKERNIKQFAECTPPPSHNSPEISLSELAPVQASYDPTKCVKSKGKPTPEAAAAVCNGNSAFYKETTTGLFTPKDLSDSHSVNSDLENEMEEVQQVMNWATPLPRLLSPLELSPLTAEHIFGEFTDTSDAESCDGTTDIGATSTMDSATLDNLFCVQDQDRSVSHVQTGYFLEKANKQCIGINDEGDNSAVATVDITYHITTDSNDDPAIATELATNRQDLKPTALQSEVSFDLVTKAVPALKEVITGHKGTSNDPVNRKDSSEVRSLLQANFAISPESLDDLNESKLEKPDLSEVSRTEINSVNNVKPGDFENKLENHKMQSSEDYFSSTTQLTVDCNPAVNSIKPDDTNNLIVDSINCHTLASNDHEYIGCLSDNGSRTGDLIVHSSLTTNEDNLISMESSSVSGPHQESSSCINSEKCSRENSSLLNTANGEQNVIGDTCPSHVEDKLGVDCKLSECSFKNVNSGNSVVGSSMDTDKYLKQLGSLPVSSFTKHTEICKQHVTKTENTPQISILKPPDQIQPNVCSGQEAHLLSNNNYHVPAVLISDAHDTNCVDVKKFTSTSVNHNFEHPLGEPNNLNEVNVNSVDKQNILSPLNNKDSDCSSSEEMECRRKKDFDLENGLSKNEKPSAIKCDTQICLNLELHETGNASNSCYADKQYERTSPETFELSYGFSSSNNLSSTSLVELKAAESEVRSVSTDSPDVDSGCSQKLVFCTGNPLRSPVNDKYSSDMPTSKAEGICDSLANPICHEMSISVVAKIKLPVDKDQEDDSISKVEHNHVENDVLSHLNKRTASSEEPSLVQSNLDMSSEKLCDINDSKFEINNISEFGNVLNGQLVAPHKDSLIQLNSDNLNDKTTVGSLLSTTNIIPTTEKQSKEIPDITLEKVQHDHIHRKLTTENTDLHDASLESSEAEDDCLMRKVSYSRTTLNNPGKSQSCIINYSDSKKCNDDGRLRIGNTQSKHEVAHMVHNECEAQIPTKIVPQNDSMKMEEDSSVVQLKEYQQTLTLDPKNDPPTEGNTIHCYPDENKKERVSEYFKSDINDTETNISNSIQKRIVPGKNLIWNFSRPDDFFDRRAVSMTKGQKTNSERVCAGTEVLHGRGNVHTGKTEILDLSKKFNDSGFDLPTFRKENHPHLLSRRGATLQNTQVGQTVLANADTSTNADFLPESITTVRSEMGPPLPPLLGPLLATPPRSLRPLSPVMSSSSRSSLPSPLDDLISPLPGTPFPPLMSPLCDGRKRKSPVFTTPSPVEKANRRILSSPLQFCSATPKHAVPVPGRLPLSATGTSTPNVQENSVKILDTMYPELSARARTLNILKGNVQLNRGLPVECKTVPVSQITGFKAITSTSTAFIKTGSNSKTNSSKDEINSCDNQQPTSNCASVNKRATNSVPMPKSAKRLRLDSDSPFAESIKDCFTTTAKKNPEAQKLDESWQNISYCELPDVVKDSSVDEDIIANALRKVEDLCFDLLPVIRSHVHVGTIPKVPVMRNEEKEVIYEFSTSKKGIADHFLHDVLKKLKTGKRTLDSACLQALCRVYVGLCRQLGDIERARILCYSIIKEDFPEPDKLLLFIISSWNDLFSLHGVISKAIQAVLKSLAMEEVGPCLRAYLNWDKPGPWRQYTISWTQAPLFCAVPLLSK
ncbi:little elongation complex subunit 1 isoform X2 [Pseudophryne corroboree]|uniref:little elongation complex subunit 1 isoform X2 n=1 Tax=Pseudophryne corroboree TaxID=495146 RepID=UPI00308122D6